MNAAPNCLFTRVDTASQHLPTTAKALKVEEEKFEQEEHSSLRRGKTAPRVIPTS